MIKNKGSFPNKYNFYGRRKGYSLSQFRMGLVNELLPELLVDLNNTGLISPSLLFKTNKEVTNGRFFLVYHKNSEQLMRIKSTLDELISDTADLVLMFNPKQKIVPMEYDLYDTLIEYFTYTEEYEKCAELLKAKQSL